MCCMGQEDKIDSIDEVLDEIINLDKHKNQNLLMISSMLNLDNKIKGCSHEEILKIEEFYKINLPYSYKKFLSRMGHNAGNYEHKGKYKNVKSVEIEEFTDRKPCRSCSNILDKVETITPEIKVRRPYKLGIYESGEWIPTPREPIYYSAINCGN